MKFLVALAMSLGLVFLAGCGAGDATSSPIGVLFVSRGGSGDIIFPRTQAQLSFADSVTVAVQTANDSATQFTLYTLFGLTELNYRQVPTAALVTFINGLNPSTSSSTFLPSSVVTMALHLGFNQNLVSLNASGTTTPLAQDAPQVFEQTSSGSFVLEPVPVGTGFTAQSSTDRRARYATLTLTDLDSGDEALLDGAVAFDLSKQISQDFFGYAGNLGLTTKPGVSGGGPPAPPGSTGSGTGSGSSSDDLPPSPPL